MNNLITSTGANLLKKRVDVVMVRDALQYSLELFGEGKEVWPDQCDRAISYLNTVSVFLQKVCELLDSSSCLPMIVAAEQSSGEFADTLHYVYTQLCDLLELITVFRSICRSPLKKAKRKREEVSRKLELLRQYRDDILRSICLFSEENLRERRSRQIRPYLVMVGDDFDPVLYAPRLEQDDEDLTTTENCMDQEALALQDSTISSSEKRIDCPCTAINESDVKSTPSVNELEGKACDYALCDK